MDNAIKTCCPLLSHHVFNWRTWLASSCTSLHCWTYANQSWPYLRCKSLPPWVGCSELDDKLDADCFLQDSQSPFDHIFRAISCTKDKNTLRVWKSDIIPQSAQDNLYPHYSRETEDAVFFETSIVIIFSSNLPVQIISAIVLQPLTIADWKSSQNSYWPAKASWAAKLVAL